MRRPSRLTDLQRDVLEAFFRRTQLFYLTGGAALAGFHLGHRDTHDLDLFALADVLDDGVRSLGDVARELEARLEGIQTAPDFRRFIVSRTGESLVVDLVRERVVQLHQEKPNVGIVRVDPAEEIFANKLCALLGRAEIRDLVDVCVLEEAGLSLRDALAAAEAKDGGLTPAQLAWVLSQISLSPDAVVPAEITAPALDQYRRGLIDRLARLAVP